MRFAVPHYSRFSKNSWLQLLDNGFYICLKNGIAQPELESVLRVFQIIDFFLETDTVEEVIREVYTLAAKYKNITVTEIQKK
jgi:TatD DNase family protein